MSNEGAPENSPRVLVPDEGVVLLCPTAMAAYVPPGHRAEPVALAELDGER
jgi:hypothetical protein